MAVAMNQMMKKRNKAITNGKPNMWHHLKHFCHFNKADSESGLQWCCKVYLGNHPPHLSTQKLSFCAI